MNETILTDFDGYVAGLPEEERNGLNGWVNLHPETERANAKKRFAAQAWVGAQTGLDGNTLADNWDIYRRGYAETLAAQNDGSTDYSWEAAAQDDGLFFQRVTQQAHERRAMRTLVEGVDKETEKTSLRTAAVTAGLGGSRLDGFQKWQEASKGRTEWASSEKFDAYEVYNSYFDEARASIPEEVMEIMPSVYGALKDGMANNDNNTVDQAFKRLGGMDLENFRQYGLPVLTAMAEADGQDIKGFWHQMGESFMRPVDNAGGAASDLGKLVLFGGMQPPDRQDIWSELWDEKNLKSLLRSLADGTVDPVAVHAQGFLGTMEQMAYDVSGSLGYMAVSALPVVGIPASLATYQDQNTADLLLRNPGMTADDANVIAAMAAPAQTALDRLGLKLIKGKLPGVNKLISRFAAPGGNLAIRGGMYAGLSTGTEYTAEILQNAAPFAAQELYDALVKDVPDADWSDFKVLDARIAWAVLPLALLGAGVNVTRDRRAARGLVEDTDAMKAFGLSEEQIAKITGQVSLEAKIAELQTAWKARTAGDPEQWRTYEKEVFDEMRAYRAEAALSPLELRREGAEWVVTHQEKQTRHTTLESAQAAIADSQIFAQEGEANATLKMLSALEANTTAPSQIGQITIAPESTVDAYLAERTAILEDPEATPEAQATATAEMEAMQNRQQILAAAEAKPMEEIDWRKIAVKGQSRLSQQRAFKEAVIRLSNGARAETLLEEKIEADNQALIAEGIQVSDFARMLREVETRTGDRYLHRYTDGTDAKADLMAVTEGVSALALVIATGKGTGKIGSALRSSHAQTFRALRAERKTAKGKALLAYLESLVAWIRSLAQQATRYRAAQQSGGAFEIDQHLNRLLGMEPQAQHEAAAAQEAHAIFDPESDYYDGADPEYIPPDNDAFSLRAVEGPFAGTAGHSFASSFALSLPEGFVASFTPETKFFRANGGFFVSPVSFALRAYHGSPYDIDKFSTEFMGTGEGVQAFGWGLYFAASSFVAKYYADILASAKNRYLDAGPERSAWLMIQSGYLALDTNGLIVRNRKLLEMMVNNLAPFKELKKVYPKFDFVDYYWNYDGKEPPLADAFKHKPNLYAVEINASEDELLDWDAPLRDQSEPIQRFFQEFDLSVSGQEAYLKSSQTKSPETVSKELFAHGIKGIKYWDGASRELGQGDRNYVIFDDSSIRIVEKNAQPVSGGVGSAGETPVSGISFTISPVTPLDAFSENLQRRMRDPKMRVAIVTKALDSLAKLRDQWATGGAFGVWRVSPIEAKLSKDEIKAEMKRRILDRSSELEQAEMERLYQEDSGAFYANYEGMWSGPILSRLRIGTSNSGALRSKTAARKQKRTIGSEYNGSDGLPFFIYGGQRAPDQVAQELADEGIIPDGDTATLWAAIRAEIDSNRDLKARMDKHKGEVKGIHQKVLAQAKLEAETWRQQVEAAQKKDWNPKAVMLRYLRVLDAILTALPPEVRGKVGGHVAIAQLSTQKAMAEEIERRIETMDKHLETYLRDEASEQIRKLVKKAKPKRQPGKKPKGHLGADAHALFDMVEKFLDLAPEEADKRINETEDSLRSTDKTPEEAYNLANENRWLRMVGALDAKTRKEEGKKKPVPHVRHTAEGLTHALTELHNIYDTGKDYWGTLETARLEDVQEKADYVVKLLGINRDAINQLKKNFLGGATLKLRSFTEIIETLLGKDSALGKAWIKAVRQGMAARTDEIIMHQAEWRDVTERITGKKGRAARRAIYDMGTDVTVNITMQRVIESTESVDIQTFLNATNPEVLGYDADTAAQILDAINALPADHRKTHVEIAMPKKAPLEKVGYTQAEALTMTMAYAQPDYAESMKFWGFDAAVMASMEEQLTEEAKALRAYLGVKYREGWYPLANIFRRMYGINLPQIKNYAPGRFYAQGEQDAGLDITGQPPIQGMRTGALGDRKRHNAEHTPENAFHTYFGHISQNAHWKALAEVSREMRGVFGDPEVKKAILSAHGPDMLYAVEKWMESIEGNGLKVEYGRFVRWLIAAQANIALAYKLVTLAKQSTAVLGAAYRIPPRAYVRGFYRLVTGQIEWDAMKSPIIQRRFIGGWTPEVRAAMARYSTTKPTWRGDFVEKGMRLIGFVDAFFTAGSAAIAYDYHYAQARKANASPEAAHLIAYAEAEDVVSRTAQPTEVTDRSLLEQTNPLWFMFASEARQKSSLWLGAWANVIKGKADARDYQSLVISHLIMGPMLTAITSAWRDATDDDDDEIFDSDNWDYKQFLLAMVTGPLQGIPLVRDIIDGFNAPDGSFLARYYQAGVAGVSLIKGPPKAVTETTEWYASRITQLMQGMDPFTGVVGSILNQSFKIADNLHETPEEAEKKAEKKARN